MKFKVEKTTLSKNGDYVTTFRSEPKVDGIFVAKGIKRFSKTSEVAVGSEHEIDPDKFKEERYSGVHEGREYTNVWWHLK